MSAVGPVRMVSIKSSAGIWRAAAEVAAALQASGVSADVAEQPADHGNHFHLGNSTRRLLPSMARRTGSVVTVHDAIPRDLWVRRLLARPQARILDRLHVVTHSRFAAELLADAGWRGQATVIPSLLPVTPIDRADVDTLRQTWETERYEITVVNAGEIRASKGIDEIIDAARRHPDVQVVLLGALTDPSMRELLTSAPANVRHVEAPSDTEFCHAIAAGDALLSIRRSSVGETSGPVVQAHRLHRPVVGIAIGTLPEECGPGDILVDADATAAEALSRAKEIGLAPLAPGSPQIPDPSDVAARLTALYQRIGW